MGTWLYKKIITGSALSVIGNLTAKASIFLATVVAARILTVEAFGLLSLIRSTVTTGAGLMMSTFGTVAIKEISLVKSNREKGLVVISMLAISVIIWIVLVVIFLMLREQIKSYVANKDIIDLVALSMAFLFWGLIAASCQALIIGGGYFKEFALTSIVSGAMAVPLTAYCTYEYGINGSLFALIVYSLLESMLKMQVLNRKLYILERFNIDGLGKIIIKLVRGSGKISMHSLIAALTFWYSRVLFVEISESGFEELGRFEVGFQLITIVTLVVGSISNVGLSYFSKNSGNEVSVYRVTMIIGLTVSIVMLGSIFIFRGFILGAFGEGYIEGKQTLSILCIMGLFFTVATIQNRYFLSKDRFFEINIVAAVSCVTLFAFLVIKKDINSEDLAIAYSIYYLCSVCMYSVIHSFKRN